MSRQICVYAFFQVDLLIFQLTLLRLMQNCFFHFPLLNLTSSNQPSIPKL